MKTKNYILISLFALTSIYFSACSPRRVSQEMSGTTMEDPILAQGRLVFKEKCQKCHPNGEAGVGPQINTIKVPKSLLKFRVRSRAFLLWTGRMPAFDKHEISKKELSSLVRYIKVLQRDQRKKKSNG